MPQARTILRGGLIAYCIIGAFLLMSRLALDPTITFSNDSASYHTGAIHIAQSGFYTSDGENPELGREPGYSLFLAGLYLLFGEGNRVAVFLAQALLHAAAVLLFGRELRRISSERIVAISTLFLLLLPPVFHLIFTVYRESIALSLLLLLSTAWLHFRRLPSMKSATIVGIAFGVVLISYIPFMFFPILLIGLCLYLRVRLQHIAAMILIAIIPLLLWGTRNAQYGEWTVLERSRTAGIWAMRADQAALFSPLDPLRCTLSEYVTRSEPEHLRKLCHSGGFAHAAWAEEFPRTEAGAHALEKEAKRRILQHPVNYTWHTAVNVGTFHLPYVNGWGFLYNALAAAGTFLLYIGIFLFLCRFRSLANREHLFFLLLALYPALIFSLTYPLPRYRMPVLFCYTLFAAIGFESVIAGKRESEATSDGNPEGNLQ